MTRVTLAILVISFFFFQEKDGIRDVAVTGVQTCALPISVRMSPRRPGFACHSARKTGPAGGHSHRTGSISRQDLEGMGQGGGSGKGRGGEKGRSRWAPDHLKKKKKRGRGDERVIDDSHRV